MAESVLPGYRFNTASHRYVSQTTGRFVARRDIVSLLDKQVTSGAERLGELTRDFHEGKIDRAVWLEQMRGEVKTAHLTNRALGAGGWDRLTQADYGAVGGRLQADYRRLEGFADDIASGKASIAQALNRSNMYAGNARVQFWDAERERRTSGTGNVLIERRVLGAAEHCNSCVDFYEQGWQMAGQLPSPGVDSECLSNCKCVIVSKEVPVLIAGEWIGTRR
tara:strand:+ start:1757 stop:2422 length:666 start_codon:yes stop_codon:yes gene_type:complete